MLYLRFSVLKSTKLWNVRQMNNLACNLFFYAVKLESRSSKFYRRFQRVLFYISVFVSCILNFLCMTSRNMKFTTTNGWLRVSLPTLPISKSISSNRVDDDLLWVKVPTFIWNILHMLLSVVLWNDWEINVIDNAKVVKTFWDLLSSLSDY